MRFSGTVTVTGAHLDADGRWRVAHEGVPEGADGPVRMLHTFPADTLTWRAVEYGLDPTDAAPLLEIVLHEPHMDDHGPEDPDFLYNTDIATARAALLARVEAVKARVTIADPHGHLDAVRAAHAAVRDDGWHAALERKHAHVAAIRATGSAPAAPAAVFTNRRTDD